MTALSGSDLPKIFVTVPEAAAILSVGRTQMYALLKDKDVTRVKLGSRSLVPLESLEAFADRLITEQAAALAPTDQSEV